MSPHREMHMTNKQSIPYCWRGANNIVKMPIFPKSINVTYPDFLNAK